MKTLANWITLSRIFLIPVIIFLFHKNQLFLCALILLYACASDFLDGYVARRFDQTSGLGALLDPVADKVFVMGLLSFLYTQSLVPFIFVILVCVRNIAQLLSIPILGWVMKIQFKVKPKMPAKWATAMTFIIIVCAFFYHFLLDSLSSESSQAFRFLTQWILIPISALLETYILVTYLPRFFQIATRKHDTFE